MSHHKKAVEQFSGLLVKLHNLKNDLSSVVWEDDFTQTDMINYLSDMMSDLEYVIAEFSENDPDKS